MTKQLSQKEKIKILEILVERDGGYWCFYCEKPFNSNKRPIIEHLNSNRNDNRLDNFVLSCQSCNIKKEDSSELEEISLKKLEMNENQIYLREKDLDKILSRKSKQDNSTEIDINEKNFDVVKNYILDRVESWNSVEFKDTLDSCVYLCKEKTGHGSHQCVRNYIASLTSSIGPFEMVRDGKKKMIVRRKTTTPLNFS